MRRPLGLILIVTWHVIVGVRQTIGVVHLLATLPTHLRPAPTLILGMTVIQWAMVATDMVIGALSLVCAYGLWRLRPWGRQLTIALAAAITVAIVAFWLQTGALIGPPLIPVYLMLIAFYLIPFGIALAIIAYLLRPQARVLFSTAPS